MKKNPIPNITAMFLFMAFSLSAHTKEPIRTINLNKWNRVALNDSVQVLRMWDELHAITTLQGIVNRKKPRLYIRYVQNQNGTNIDEYWWNKYRKKGEWLEKKDTLECSSVADAVMQFRNELEGMVVYDSKIPSTSNVASTVAGVEKLVAVRFDASPQSLYSQLIKSGLKVKQWLVNPDGTSLFTGKGLIPDTHIPSTGSTKADPYVWAIEKYVKTKKCNPRYAAYYIDQFWRKMPMRTAANHHQLTNHDFFVSKGAFFFDLSPWADEPATDAPWQNDTLDVHLLKSLLLENYRQNKGKHFCHIGGFPSWAFKYTKHAGGRHEDVATEWEFSRIISAYNAFKDADAIALGALANASFWQHFPLEKRYPQQWTDTKALQEKGFLDKNGKVDRNRKYILFYVGDYDASSWIAQTTPFLWDEPNRGKLPLMWCISPVLAERVPMAMHNYRTTATPNDYFAAADNGAGYLLPGMLKEPRPLSGLPDGLKAWEKHCKKHYRKWELSISGFIIDGEAPPLDKDGLDCYEAFSPNGIVPQKAPLASLHKNMPVLRSDYDIVDSDCRKAANVVMDRINERPIPFHWFRAILKSPTWYLNLRNELLSRNSQIEWVDAPTFFELLRRFLKEEEEKKE